MASWLVQRRLTQNADRLRSLRAELAQIDEQLEVVAGEADDHAIRAMVSDSPLASVEANDARKHADAMRRHRQHLTESIDRLGRRQDELLDGMTRQR
ncbi:MAG: hypothetical protein ABIO83_07275 [Ilumatobacteraceae bacterium]